MSVLNKKWIIKNNDPKQNTLEKIIFNREHLNLKNELTQFHDPYLFTDMEKAVARVKSAIDSNEKIIVFGDYDVDGITGTAILVHTLRHLNATVSFRIPNRVNDGYGLSEKFIDEFIEKKIDLVITTDCGISCTKEVEKANANNIDVIITDHHTVPPVVPPALAIIHPKHDSNYPYDELTGSGVAFKFAQALLTKLSPESDLADYLVDLASLGTVADLGPLKDENRLIVQKGLARLHNTKWQGLKKIMENSGVKDGDVIDASTIGFRIAPRINAAGRIGDPYTPLFLLLQEGDHSQIEKLTSELENLNTNRQKMTSDYFEEINEVVKNFDSIPPIIIAEDPNWHVGVLGLIAGKLAEKYSRPSIIFQDKGDTLVASARSPEFFNVIEAISVAKDLLMGFGGHPQAAGLSIKKENYSKFKEIITEYATDQLKGKDLSLSLKIDCEIEPAEINLELIKQMNILSPFGIGNAQPTFLLKNAKPVFVKTIGQNSNHLKFAVETGNKLIDVIAFQMGEHAELLKSFSQVDLVFRLEVNRWNGKESLQLQLLDLRSHQE